MLRTRTRNPPRSATKVVFTALLIATVLNPAPLSAEDDGAATPTEKSEQKPTDEPGTKTKQAKSPTFLPIPILITEPAIGVGGGVALAYFHEKTEGDDSDSDDIPPVLTIEAFEDRENTKKPPPTVTAVAGAYTDNGTWAGGIAHSASWRQDTIRYVGALAYANVNSTVYRFNIPFDFGIEGGLIYQDLAFRIGRSDFFLGGKLFALSADATVEIGTDRPVGLVDGDVADVGIALEGIFDTRDNTMTPETGQFVEANVWRHSESLGGDYDYWKGKFKITSFHRLNERFVLGWRVEGDAVSGKAPFWAYPWINLRGIPALRYQNERTAEVEIESRYRFAERWGLVGFVGRGRARGDNPAFDVDEKIFAGGIGGRWLFHPDENIWIGIDIARGPEDTYWYIQVGQAW